MLSASFLSSPKGVEEPYIVPLRVNESGYGELTVFDSHLHWCAAEFLVVAAAGLDVPDRLHLAVAKADEAVPAAYHSVLLGWNQQ